MQVSARVKAATRRAKPIATAQRALPEATCSTVYATTGYEASVRNLSQTSLDRDMVFSDDGGVHELATMTGDVTDGFVAALTVPV